MKAIIYLRVSTEEQAKSGLGLEAQRDACMARVPAGADVSVFADEGVSGSTPIADREQLPEALEALGKGDVLIVAKRDRIGRDVMMVGALEFDVKRRGASILSAAGEGTDSDDPMSRVMRVIVDAFAQYERDMIRARTKAALAAKRRRGEACGGAVPFGYKVISTELRESGKSVRVLAPCGHEQEAIRRMRELRSQGIGWRAIAQALAASGIRGRGCSVLGHMTVKRILESDREFSPAVGASVDASGG